jgi:serine/threonine-protein kinase PknG
VQPCARPDCGRGVIDEQGFCTECGLPPAEPAAAAAGNGPSPAGREAQSPAGQQADGGQEVGGGAAPDPGTGVAALRSDPWWGLGLIEEDRVPEAAEIPADPAEVLPEEHRFCLACGEPVGRGHDGTPGRAAGYCPACGTRFDFSPDAGGRTVASRYEVQRTLGWGAYGAAYLAYDRNLETHVVLKALLDESVVRTATRERSALVGLRHDSIVRILNYEPEGPHLVLEYVPGVPLSARAGDRPEVLLGHGLRILQALDYLHARGLLHCDVKPVNIIRFREETPDGPHDRVRLIDFGSVRSLNDAGPVTAYTETYAPPKPKQGPPDPEHLRPTPGFDLYGLGVTLSEVCRRHLRHSAEPGADSLQLLLQRATDVRTPQRRFRSARQFAEQLSGVIRQVVAAPPARRRVTRPSALFGSMVQPLHGRLGAPRPLGHWITGRLRAGDGALLLPPPFATPDPREIALALPTPVADPDEPDVTGRAGSALAHCRLALRYGDAAGAGNELAAARLPAWHWLHTWYAGLIALANEDVATAAGWFTSARQALPGELIPQLALGLCAELAGDLPAAQSYHSTVFGTAPALGAAGFGLARVHLLAGRRAQAVAVAESLAQEFRFEHEARVAAVRLRVAVTSLPACDVPSGEDLARAREAAARLDVDPSEEARLLAEIRYAEFLRDGDREKLSEGVREVARHAATEQEYIALIDRANQLRPPLWGARRKRHQRTGLWRTREKHATGTSTTVEF